MKQRDKLYLLKFRSKEKMYVFCNDTVEIKKLERLGLYPTEMKLIATAGRIAPRMLLDLRETKHKQNLLEIEQTS